MRFWPLAKTLIRGKCDPTARTLTQGSGVVSLANMYLEYSSASRKARRGLLTKYGALLDPDTSTVSSLWSLAQTRIYPLVRSRFDRVTIEINQRRESKKMPSRAARPFLGELELVVGYDHGPSISQVSVETVTEWGVSVEQVIERAAANLRALPFPTWESVGDSVWKLESEGGYNESFMQWPKVFASLPIKGDAILTITPNRGLLLASGLDAFDALAQVAQESLSKRPWPLSGAVFKVVEARLEPFSTPELAERLRTLANLSIESVYEAQKEVLQAHCEAIGDPVYVASYGLLSVKNSPQNLHSWCSWAEGVESLLPITDYIAFARAPEGVRKTLLVKWSESTAIVGRLMRETSEDPPRVQVDEFPTKEEWSELEKCALVVS